MKTDDFINDKDRDLLFEDRFTFAVLNNILKKECELIKSDHENVIMCHSLQRYPAWIWTRDGAPERVKSEVYDLAETYRPLEKGCKFILRYDLAEYFIARSAKKGLKVGISKGLIAYECPQPIEPERFCGGEMTLATNADIDEVAVMRDMFAAEIGEAPLGYEMQVAAIKEMIAEKRLYLWKNSEGKTVAFTVYVIDDGLGRVSNVFTLPEHRRGHFAQNLVYRVTKIVKDLGAIPVLYANSDYVPSNACYRKIGYEERGRVCCISIT